MITLKLPILVSIKVISIIHNIAMVNYPFREHHIYTYNLGLFTFFFPLPIFPSMGESVKNNCSFF